MPIADDLRKTLSDPTPLYALAGAGDLAVEKLKTVPERAAALAADRKAAQEKATARLTEAQAKLTEAQSKVTEAVQTLPTDFKTLQEKAQGLALQGVGRAAELAVKAREAYDELAVRGKAVVERQRKDAAEEAEAAIEATASKADLFAAEVAEVAEVTEAPADVEPAAEAPAPKPARKTAARKPRSAG